MDREALSQGAGGCIRRLGIIVLLMQPYLKIRTGDIYNRIRTGDIERDIPEPMQNIDRWRHKDVKEAVIAKKLLIASNYFFTYTPF